MTYRDLHTAGEDKIASYLRRKGHHALKEHRTAHGVLDVYDSTEDVCWEVVTAKIVRSSHEQDEAIVAKIFRYTLVAPQVRFLVVSYGHDELEFFHRMGVEHWHSHNGWTETTLGRLHRHGGKSATQAAHDIYGAMLRLAPLSEWVAEDRRARHPDRSAAVQAVNDELGLPRDFLLGLWRDWRLNWVWKLEGLLPEWAERCGYESVPGSVTSGEVLAQGLDGPPVP